MDESIENGFTLIETEGRKVGVINGLSVLSTGEYSLVELQGLQRPLAQEVKA